MRCPPADSSAAGVFVSRPGAGVMRRDVSASEADTRERSEIAKPSPKLAIYPPTTGVVCFRVEDSGETVGLSMLDPVMVNSLRRFRAGV